MRALECQASFAPPIHSSFSISSAHWGRTWNHKSNASLCISTPAWVSLSPCLSASHLQMVLIPLGKGKSSSSVTCPSGTHSQSVPQILGNKGTHWLHDLVGQDHDSDLAVTEHCPLPRLSLYFLYFQGSLHYLKLGSDISSSTSCLPPSSILFTSACVSEVQISIICLSICTDMIDKYNEWKCLIPVWFAFHYIGQRCAVDRRGQRQNRYLKRVG